MIGKQKPLGDFLDELPLQALIGSQGRFCYGRMG